MWYCDMCGEPIQEAGEGLVIWRMEGRLRTGFRIVHIERCDLPGFPASVNLPSFLGPDGLIYLTSYLTAGPILRSQGREEEVEVLRVWELVELIRRLHVPHYEEARRYFGHPYVVEHYADAQEVAPYNQEQLADIIERGSQDS